MFSKVQPFIVELQNYFDSVTVANDNALQQPNRAVLFLDRLSTEYLTSSRKRKSCEVAILFSVAGKSDQAYMDADAKIASIESALEAGFSYYELREIQYSYQANINRLFVFVNAVFYWEEV